MNKSLKIWDWDWIFGRAVKAIFSLGVRSPWMSPISNLRQFCTAYLGVTFGSLDIPAHGHFVTMDILARWLFASGMFQHKEILALGHISTGIFWHHERFNTGTLWHGDISANGYLGTVDILAPDPKCLLKCQYCCARSPNVQILKHHFAVISL